VTTGELKDYYIQLLYVHRGEKTTGIEKLVDRAIIMGKNDFWSAYPWAFKEKHDTLTTAASTETVDMPGDFEGICSIRERESDNGRKLIRLGADEYDRRIPYSADLAQDKPAYYKIYFDAADNLWKAALYPTPNAAYTLYLTYHIIEDVGIIPEKYDAGLTAFVGKYIWLPGTAERQAAIEQSIIELERLKQVDDPDVETPTRFLDANEAINPRSKKWYEDWN